MRSAKSSNSALGDQCISKEEWRMRKSKSESKIERERDQEDRAPRERNKMSNNLPFRKSNQSCHVVE